MIYLALDPGDRATIKDIADDYGISKNHLMKVVNVLAKGGYVSANRGPGGGLELARPADEITVGEIVRLTEDTLQLVECFGAVNQCTITPACTLKGIFQESLEAMFGVLDSYSVQDLVQCKTQLKKLL